MSEANCLEILRELTNGWQLFIDEDEPLPFEAALLKANTLLQMTKEGNDE